MEEGFVPSEPPPDWCDINNDVIKRMLCFKKDSSLVDNYHTDPSNSSSIIRTRSHDDISIDMHLTDELLRVLNKVDRALHKVDISLHEVNRDLLERKKKTTTNETTSDKLSTNAVK